MLKVASAKKTKLKEKPSSIFQENFFKEAIQYKLKNNLNLYFLYYPNKKKHSKLTKIWHEFWQVLLDGCMKDGYSEKAFRKKINMTKTVLAVDYLLVAGHEEKVVAFTSGTFITPEVFYLNSSIVKTEHQTRGIGAVITALLCKKAIEDKISSDTKKPYIVCRTRNFNVASSLLGAFKEGGISTETVLDNKMKNFFVMLSKYLNCRYNARLGVAYNVYPNGLVRGIDVKKSRVREALDMLGPRDACYVYGKLNMKLINFLLKRNIV